MKKGDKRPLIKERIKKKFKTQAKFCELAKYDPYKLQILLAVKNPDQIEVSNVLDLIKKTNSGFGKNDIKPKTFLLLQKAIESAGGVKKLCEAHPKLNIVSVYHIANGTRKRITPKVKELATILNVELNDKEESDKK